MIRQLAFSYVATSIAHLISFEVGHLVDGPSGFASIAGVRHGASVSMVGMETIIYVTPEVFVAMKPGAGANEDPAGKPFRAVVAVRSTAIRRGVVVTVRAFRGGSDADSDLSIYSGSGHR